MTSKVKAKDLREGDRIVTDDGTYTVIKNKQVKIKIPARYVKQQRFVVEANRRKDGRASKKTDIVTTWDSDTFEIEDRMDLRSRYDRFMEKNKHYVNAFAATVTGCILTVVLGSTGTVDSTAAQVLFATTAVLGASLIVYAYLRER